VVVHRTYYEKIMNFKLQIAIVVLSVIGTIYLYAKVTRQRPPKGLSFPPGPKGRLFLGGLDLMASVYNPEMQVRWFQKYGDLVSINILGTRLIFVNSSKIAHELFEKRSSVYSDRFSQTMLKMTGWDWNWTFMRYGQKWREHRRIFHQYFNSNSVSQFHAVQTQATLDLIWRLSETPTDFEEHIKYFSAYIIMKAAYNYELLAKNDPYIDIVHTAMEGLSETMNPGSFLVDFIPILRYLPNWFPGAGFKERANYWAKSTQEVREMPFKRVKEAIANGCAGYSVASSALTWLTSKGMPPDRADQIVRDVTGQAYAAGARTTSDALLTIILCLLMCPETQKKAQAELDTVAGDGLPTMEDRPQLPYIDAICNEAHRWQTTIPFGVAHAAYDDDIYENYFIPKGSIVIANAHVILHEEEAYGPFVERFIPERLLEAGMDPPMAQFGFGRRVCPGRYLASGSLFIATAMILKLFDITPAVDKDGNEIPVLAEPTTGALIAPKPFKCRFKPRTSHSEKLLFELRKVQQ